MATNGSNKTSSFKTKEGRERDSVVKCARSPKRKSGSRDRAAGGSNFFNPLLEMRINIRKKRGATVRAI